MAAAEAAGAEPTPGPVEGAGSMRVEQEEGAGSSQCSGRRGGFPVFALAGAGCLLIPVPVLTMHTLGSQTV